MARFLWSRIFGWARHKAAESHRFGNYHIVRVVHEGEKTFVYQARSPDDDGLYAIKAYKPLFNRTARRICRRYHLRTEGEIGLSLNPPPGISSRDYPIVKTIAYGWEFNDPTRCYFLVQEFVEGFNLKHLIACSHPMLRERRLEIANAVARALTIIHDRGLVHRDICTDNVLLYRDGRVKLVDLGFMVPHGLSFKEKTGTPSYMSPEQFLVRPLNPGSDIYSFGVVLFEIFTGRLPFTSVLSSDNPNLMMRRTSELMAKHLKEKPQRPLEIAPDLPDGIEPIIMKCLEKSPERRYPSTRHLLTDLSQVREREAPD